MSSQNEMDNDRNQKEEITMEDDDAEKVAPMLSINPSSSTPTTIVNQQGRNDVETRQDDTILAPHSIRTGTLQQHDSYLTTTTTTMSGTDQRHNNATASTLHGVRIELPRDKNTSSTAMGGGDHHHEDNTTLSGRKRKAPPSPPTAATAATSTAKATAATTKSTVEEDDDNTTPTATSSSSRKLKAPPPPPPSVAAATTTTTTEATTTEAPAAAVGKADDEDDEFTATKKLLTIALGGKEDVAEKIMSDVSDYIRLDDLEEIKSITDSTTGGGVALICSKLQKYLNKNNNNNNNDEEVFIASYEKLYKDFFVNIWKETYEYFFGTDDNTYWIRYSDRYQNRPMPWDGGNIEERNYQEMLQSNGHHIILKSMSYYPNNSTIQQWGSFLLAAINKYGLLLGDDRTSYSQFMLSEGTMSVFANTVKQNMTTNKRAKQEEEDHEEAAKIVGVSLLFLGNCKAIGQDHGLDRTYYQNMESLGIYPLAFEALQHYPHDANCVRWGFRILRQPLRPAFRNHLPAGVLDRIINDKTRNIFDQTIDRAVDVQVEMDPQTDVAGEAELLREVMLDLESNGVLL